MIALVIWLQSGFGFVYFDVCKVVEMRYDEGAGAYSIFADDIELGCVKSSDEANRVLLKIANAFTSASVEVDPW